MLFTSVNLKVFFCIEFRFGSFQILILCKGRIASFVAEFAYTKHIFQWFEGSSRGEN